MPHSQTILRARSVAFSMSLPAPVVMWPRNISSAMRPPIITVIVASRYSFVCEYLSSIGSCIVTPRARPRGMIVTLWSGSASGRIAATSACPPSWYAVFFFSSSVMIMDLRSGPIMTLSLAYSKSIISTFFLLKRAAFRAASLTRLARSAPENPGVPRAMTERSTFSESGVCARVDLEDLLAPAQVGAVDDDAPVEAAGPQERRVEDVRAVGRGDEDDALVGVEAVHLDEQRVQRLLALVVPAAEARAAVPPDGVDLVDEDDAGRVLLALLEEVAHARGADADEHLDEVGAGDREEGDVRLAGDGAREQRLAGARRARSAARPWGSCRRASGTSAGPSGTR